MMYTMTCDQGHEPISWDVEAATPEEAYEKFMAMPEMQDHSKEMHPDMNMETMNDDEKQAMKDKLMAMIKPKETM